MKRNIFNLRGFTLIEILVAAFIIGVLTAIAMPLYFTHVEQTRGANALENLHLMRTAQAISMAETEQYQTQANIAVLQNFLNFETNDGDWVYTLENVAATTFRAVATRTAANPAYNNLRITIDQDSTVVSVAPYPH